VTGLLDSLRAEAMTFAILAFGVAIALASGIEFASMHTPEPIVAGPGVTTQKMLGDYVPDQRGTPSDTPVFVLEGSRPGGTLLLFGGTHPQEISGLLAAVLTIENVTVQQGRIIVVPQANRSGFTHTEPLEGYPHSFTIETPHGQRWFRLGMRLTNPIHQWPDPDLYVHPQSGEPMVGWEARNLNRNYPGFEGGRYTARLGRAYMSLAQTEKADLVFDLHEAHPEYPVINLLVAHERAFEIAAEAVLMLQGRKIPMGLEKSPRNLRGLSHREFGDHANAFALLAETANPAMGRFRGRTDETLVVEGRDVNYLRAAGLKRLFVPFTESGWPVKLRVARQLAALEEILNAYNELNPNRPIRVSGIPAYKSVAEAGIGQFLRPAPGKE
jgi:predicted deacylase